MIFNMFEVFRYLASYLINTFKLWLVLRLEFAPRTQSLIQSLRCQNEQKCVL